MRYFLLLFLCLFTGCMSSEPLPLPPTEKMTKEEVSQLSSLQLCRYKRNYADETKLEIELGKRDLDCSDEGLYCLKRGIEPMNPQYESCRNTSRMIDNAMSLGNMILNHQ